MPTAHHYAHGAHFAPTCATLAAAALCAAALATKSHAQTWTNPAGGDWSNPANWSPAVVPSGMSEINLGLSGAYTVALGFNQALDSTLTILNPQAALLIPAGKELVAGGASVNSRAVLANRGQIRVGSSESGAPATISVVRGLTLQGSGTLTLSAQPGDLNTARILGSGSNAYLQQFEGHTIEGTGRIESLQMSLGGAVLANVPGRVLEFKTAFILPPAYNNGLIAATNGGTFRVLNQAIYGRADAGVIRADDGSRVEVGGSAKFVEGFVETIGTGSVTVLPGSTLVLGAGSLRGPTNRGNILVEATAVLHLNTPFTNDGFITINTSGSSAGARMNIGFPTAIEGSGTLFLNGDPTALDSARVSSSTMGYSLRLGPGTRTIGQGVFTRASVLATGTLSPGRGDSLGRLHFEDQSPMLAPSTVLEYDLGPDQRCDRITSVLRIALAGSLRVRLPANLDPPIGASFELMTAPINTLSAFTALDLPSAPAPLTWVVSIEPHRVTVGLGCNPADIAQADGRPAPDGLVTNGDFQLFFQSYFLGCTRTGLPCSPADIAGSDGAPGPDGQVDNGDFTLFFNAFFDGC